MKDQHIPCVIVSFHGACGRIRHCHLEISSRASGGKGERSSMLVQPFCIMLLMVFEDS